jgi:hypothetical protein
MLKPGRLVFVIATIILAGLFLPKEEPVFSAPSQWKITSLQVCRTRSGALDPTLRVLGSFPVYSFFIPRPVWTVNGAVVDAQPVYDHGRLVEFHLLSSSGHLKSGSKNNIKFALSDSNGAKVFFFDSSRIPAGECYEFF